VLRSEPLLKIVIALKSCRLQTTVIVIPDEDGALCKLIEFSQAHPDSHVVELSLRRRFDWPET
jgi:hypothetical protein